MVFWGGTLNSETLVSHNLYPADKVVLGDDVRGGWYILIPGHFPFFKVQSETSQLSRRGVRG